MTTEQPPINGQVIPLHPDRLATSEALEGEVVPYEEEECDDDLPHPVIEHGGYIAVGALVVYQRYTASRSTAIYDRAITAAETIGDMDKVLELVKERREFQNDRHARRFDYIELPARILRWLPWLALAFLATLLVLGVLLALATGDPRQIGAPVLGFAWLVHFVYTLARLLWLPALLITLAAAGWGLWLLGLRSAEAGEVSWLAARVGVEGDRNIVVTADSVVVALQHLPIAVLKRAFKEGWIPTVPLPPIREGKGYHTVVGLPLGVTAAMVADQRAVLARNLHRAEVETWPADAEKAGTGNAGELDLWIADPGALSKAAPEYPLLHEGTADVFKGVPGGVSPRGDLITIPIIGKNIVAGGQMGQGKSNACRVIMLGCALDPIVELNVFVFAANGDFDSYRPRLARYHRGIDDETAYAALEHLRWLYGEVARREGRLAELSAKKVTRGLAEKHPDLRPIVSLFSECHELFGHSEYGEEAGELACKTAKRARKTAIVEAFDTQSSRKGAIPPALIELMSVNACFYVKNWRNNDGFLGDGCFAAGIRATELRPGRDVGTSLIIGVSDAAYELLKWYFVEVDDDTGFDAAADVIARAVAQLAPGTRTQVDSPVAAIETRDLLDDIDTVLGHDRVTLADLASLLRSLAPRWEPYEKLTGRELEATLTKRRVRTTRTNGVLRLDPADFREALSRLSMADLDEE